MSSEIKYQSLFNPSGCLTLEAMNRFHASDLAEAEKSEVEDHVKKCELCSDAVEGLTLITDRNKLNAIVSEINENLSRNLESKTGTIKPLYGKSGARYLYFAAAASVLILIAIFSYLNFHSPVKDNQMSVLSPTDYEIRIPEIPVPKLTGNQFQESSPIPARQLPATEKKEILILSEKPERVNSASGGKYENFIPAIEELKSTDTFLTEALAEEDIISVESENKDSKIMAAAIASNQPVEYYLGEVIIKAQNTNPDISEFALSSKSDNMKAVDGIMGGVENRDDRSLERAAKRKQNLKNSVAEEQLEENAGQGLAEEAGAKETDHFFRTIDSMPEFPGGEAAMINYFESHLEYPQYAKMQGIFGTVYISFIVEQNGKINSVEVQKGLEEECNKSAMSVIQSMPDWQPGYFEGKPVRVRFTIPITFRLQ
ncbi:MAG: energy transducer TonB [Bacteroidetes bacterium]|nr:energy transducer TonB [Bacteroidota bacterium]